MKFTKYGHAAFLIEEGASKVLIDPGSFSSGFEDLTALTAVLYTHIHADHYDEGKLSAILAHNPDVQLIADSDTAVAIEAAGHTVKVAGEDDVLELGSFRVKVIGHDHAIIHRLMPQAKNVGYFINDRAFYPGDALTVPRDPVEILLLPVEAPWTKVAEVIDYMLEVAPKIALPSHESVSAVPDMQYGMIGGVAKTHNIDFRTMKAGESVEL
jgi:L-ascorbate metabolism protein UlaG (beta-lactamase superfamily)